jgi:hypothetical protein
MKKDTVVSIFASFFAVALATTLVLPDRKTPEVVTNFFSGLAKATNAVIGRG